MCSLTDPQLTSTGTQNIMYTDWSTTDFHRYTKQCVHWLIHDWLPLIHKTLCSLTDPQLTSTGTQTLCSLTDPQLTSTGTQNIVFTDWSTTDFHWYTKHCVHWLIHNWLPRVHKTLCSLTDPQLISRGTQNTMSTYWSTTDSLWVHKTLCSLTDPWLTSTGYTKQCVYLQFHNCSTHDTFLTDKGTADLHEIGFSRKRAFLIQLNDGVVNQIREFTNLETDIFPLSHENWNP